MKIIRKGRRIDFIYKLFPNVFMEHFQISDSFYPKFSFDVSQKIFTQKSLKLRLWKLIIICIMRWNQIFSWLFTANHLFGPVIPYRILSVRGSRIFFEKTESLHGQYVHYAIGNKNQINKNSTIIEIDASAVCVSVFGQFWMGYHGSVKYVR